MQVANKLLADYWCQERLIWNLKIISFRPYNYMRRLFSISRMSKMGMVILSVELEIKYCFKTNNE